MFSYSENSNHSSFLPGDLSSRHVVAIYSDFNFRCEAMQGAHALSDQIWRYSKYQVNNLNSQLRLKDVLKLLRFFLWHPSADKMRERCWKLSASNRPQIWRVPCRFHGLNLQVRRIYTALYLISQTYLTLGCWGKAISCQL